MSMPSPLRSRADSMPLPCMMMSLAPAGSGANMASCWTPMFCSAVLLGMTLAMRNLVFFPTSVCRLAPIPMTSSASQWSTVLQSSSASGRSDMGTRLGDREARGLVSRAFAPPPAVDAYLSVRVSGRTRMSWLSGVAGRAACR